MDLHNKEKLRKRKRRKGQMLVNSLVDRLSIIFYNYTGHRLSSIASFNNFTTLLHQRVDAASIGIGRMLFGIMMLLDIPEERSGSDLDFRWGELRDCRFSLFPFIKSLSLAKMGIVYFFMWLGALGIALGYKFRLSCFLFVTTYWYIFLLDKSSWNNHSYLYGLVAFIFLFTDAHHFCSIDAWRNNLQPTVPFWNYFLLKFQFFILYFIAGLKKFSTEWLDGYQLNNLSHHWVFAPFRMILGAEWTNILFVHWFATIFDTSIAFFLIYRATRPLSTVLASAFHLMNSRLFNIGMFPWVCLAELPLFYEHNWPRTLWRKLKCTSTISVEKIIMIERRRRTSSVNDGNVPSKRTLKEKFTSFLILIYCCLQFFLPYSHFITIGYNGWVNGIYGYSFDMMISSWETALVSIRIVDNGNQMQHFIEPLAFTDSYRWTQYPDMANQYAHCINENLKLDFHHNTQTALTSDNFSIYFDIWCSLNGRFQQRIYNPTVDLLKSDWHPFRKPSFILPLLREYSHLRRDIAEISKDVYSWNNYTDLMFVADFPGLTFQNYIVPEMDNVTLSVLEGAVKIEYQNESSSSLSKGQNFHIKSGVFHKVTTLSDVPSCYLYTYINSTRQLNNLPPQTAQEFQMKPLLSLADEFHSRWENYKKFLYHVANSFLFEIYSVPMPRRLREIHEM